MLHACVGMRAPKRRENMPSTSVGMAPHAVNPLAEVVMTSAVVGTWEPLP